MTNPTEESRASGDHGGANGVSDGTRTRDILDHNQVLYHLSYTHHARNRKPVNLGRDIVACRSRGRPPGYPPCCCRMSAATARASSLLGPGWGTNAVRR